MWTEPSDQRVTRLQPVESNGNFLSEVIREIKRDWRLKTEDMYQLCRRTHVGLEGLESDTYFLKMLDKSEPQFFLLIYLKVSCKWNICCAPGWLNDFGFDPNYNSV